jgi:serine/threonine protein phosphatase PrpC
MGCNIMKQITPDLSVPLGPQDNHQDTAQLIPQLTHGLATQGPWLLAWASQVGSRHLANGKPCEDSIGHRFHANQSIALAVGDGVSGGAAGEIASFAAVRYCTDFGTDFASDFGDESALQTHLNSLDEHVQQAIAQHTGRAGASTLAAAWLGSDGAGWLTHLGDVRAYRIAAGAAEPHRLTLDHTYANLKEEPPPYVPLENPARMVGNGIAGTPPLQAFQLDVGQALLLCTDGLHGFVTDAQINEVLVRNAQATQTDQAAEADQANQPSKAMHPRTALAMARRLVRLAVKQGSDDDIAVLLLWRLPVAAQTED